MLSNAYFLAKFRFDTAENEPAKNLQNFANSRSRRCGRRRRLIRPPRALGAGTPGRLAGRLHRRRAGQLGTTLFFPPFRTIFFFDFLFAQFHFLPPLIFATGPKRRTRMENSIFLDLSSLTLCVKIQYEYSFLHPRYKIFRE